MKLEFDLISIFAGTFEFFLILASSEFKKMILTMLSSKLSDSEISNLGRMYNNIDKNKDGQLALSELV